MSGSDDQEVEIVKKFIKEYGPWIVAGLVIGLGAMFGWRSYQDSQLESQAARTQAFEAVLGAFLTEAAQPVDSAQLEALAGSTQGALARLHLAAQAVNEGDFVTARDLLKQALNETDVIEIKHVIWLRLARVELALEDYNQAQKTLAQVDLKSYAAQKSEIEGDLYFAQQEYAKAQVAYQKAADLAEQGVSAFLQMKLDNVANFQ